MQFLAAVGIHHRQLAETDNGVHGRADLVAHVGEELALGAVRRLGMIPRQAQLVHQSLLFETEPDRLHEHRPELQRSTVDASQEQQAGKAEQNLQRPAGVENEDQRHRHDGKAGIGAEQPPRSTEYRHRPGDRAHHHDAGEYPHLERGIGHEHRRCQAPSTGRRGGPQCEAPEPRSGLRLAGLCRAEFRQFPMTTGDDAEHQGQPGAPDRQRRRARKHVAGGDQHADPEGQQMRARCAAIQQLHQMVPAGQLDRIGFAACRHIPAIAAPRRPGGRMGAAPGLTAAVPASARPMRAAGRCARPSPRAGRGRSSKSRSSGSRGGRSRSPTPMKPASWRRTR